MTTGRINQVASLIEGRAARTRPAQKGAAGSDASATVVRKERRSFGHTGAGEDPMPAAFTESEGPNRPPRAAPSPDRARTTRDARAASGSARTRNARAERQPIVRHNAGALGMQHRKPTPSEPKRRSPHN